MFRLQDLVLITIVYASILAAFLFPRFAALFNAVPVYALMAILFLSFLSVSLREMWRRMRCSAGFLCFLLAVKLMVLPTIMFLVFRGSLPRYAMAALLISGVSTGVTAPYFAAMLSADSALVLAMVVASSCLVPLTLPVLVKVLAGHSLEMPVLPMMQMLGSVIFIPFVAAQMLQRISGRVAETIVGRKQILSLVLFAVVNLGVFSRYSEYFFRRGSEVFVGALLISVLFAVIYFVVGAISSVRLPGEIQLSTIISLVHINNVLVVVFSSRFFGPLEPTVAGLYTIPFYLVLLPLRAYHRRASTI